MAQYFVIANLSKKEYICPSIFTGGLNIGDVLNPKTSVALIYLLTLSSLKMQGYEGRWAGDQIVIIGDYYRSDLHPITYSGVLTWTNISDKVKEELEEVN